jgi:nicotinate phosphoribosyltransferase
VLERHAPQAGAPLPLETELRHLVGTGVSAAAIWRMREALDEAGFPKVRIVASSGFGVGKCRVDGGSQGPDRRGRNRQLHPRRLVETYATADIVEYDGQARVKVGREFLLRHNGSRKRNGGHGA